jgi:hypothetical protein
MDHTVLIAVLDTFTLPTNADITLFFNPMTTLNAISEMIDYSRSLTTRICELIRAAHISQQVDLMIPTVRKERHQLWKHNDKFEREILISQKEATPELPRVYRKLLCHSHL